MAQLYTKSFIMKKLNLLMLSLVLMAMSSCAVIGGIFKAGAVVGIIAVIVVIAIIIWIISLFRGK
jgi:hypothetical protein